VILGVGCMFVIDEMLMMVCRLVSVLIVICVQFSVEMRFVLVILRAVVRLRLMSGLVIGLIFMLLMSRCL